ncbi:hypothetical protein [Dysgonomonas reticulitermitis]
MTDSEMKMMTGGYEVTGGYSSGGGCGAYLCNSDSNCPPAVSGYSHCTKCKEAPNTSGYKGFCS